MRDSSEDSITRIYQRPPPFSLDRAMVQRIMGELRPKLGVPAAAAARPIVTRRAPAAPNVFLTPGPPDVARALAWGPGGSAAEPRVIRRRRSLMPWAAFLMTFSITFGVAKDPVLRHHTASQIKTAAMSVSVGAQSSAMRLWSFVTRSRT